MKTFVAGLLTFVLLVTAILIYGNVLNSKVAHMVNAGNGLIEQVGAGDYSAAEKSMEALEQSFEASGKMLRAFAEHSELERMEERLTTMKEKFSTGDYTAMRTEWAVLKLLLKNHLENVEFKWYNVL